MVERICTNLDSFLRCLFNNKLNKNLEFCRIGTGLEGKRKNIKKEGLKLLGCFSKSAD